MCFGFSNVQAAESIFGNFNITRNSLSSIAKANSLSSSTAYLGLSAERESGESYAWNMKTDGTPGAVAWKITKRNSSTDQTKDYSNLYYCLNAEQGFGITNGEMADGKIDYYDYSTEMNTNNKELITSKVNNQNELSANYNKILWILDNSYIPTRSNSYKNSTEYKNLMKKIGVTIENDESDMNEEQIELVQQMAIWYYTNSSNATKYHLSSNSLPSLYYKKSGSSEYKQLSSIYYGTTEYGEQISGRVLQNKMDVLFKYLINNADASYTKSEPTLSLSNTGAKVEESGNYYIAGPFKLTGTNTENIKEITASVNKNFTLLDSSKNVVSNNEFSKVVNTNGFYLRFNKSDITETTQITLGINYKYDTRTLTFMTGNNNTNQPVAIIETEEKNRDISTNITINLVEVSVEKIWDDNNNQDGKRPTSIKVQLYKNGEKVGDSITLNSNTLTHTWTGLLAGNIYTVKELNSNGVAIEDGGNYNSNYTTKYVITGNKTVITNKYIPEVISKVVKKLWEDSDNQDGTRPDNVNVTLFKKVDGIKQAIDTVELNKSNNWAKEWNNLPKYENGKEITYTVEETVPNGYEAKYSDDTFTITNKYTPGTVSKSVNKEWIDNDNQDGIRPDEVTVQLYANGVAYGDAVKLNKNNAWTYTWSGLPEKENGKTINYEVKETKIGNVIVNANNANNYAVDYKINENNTVITNTHIPEKIQKTVEKRWVSENDEEENRPSNVTVQLYADGVAVGESVILNADNSWKYTWNNLDKYKNGTEIIYTVKEIKIGNDIVENDATQKYKVTYSNDTFIITNTYIPPEKVFDLALRKFITNINDESYNREPVVDTSTIATTGTATYKHTKTPLSVQVGDIVTYTIRVYNEGEKDGYVSEITDYLPEWLDFLPEDSLNQEYLWKQDANNTRKITTDITAKESATGENKYSNRENKQLLKAFDGGDKLDYIDVQIKCKVNEKAQVKQLITNIAEISGMQDENGEDVKTDRDSTKANVNLPDDKDLPNYKGNESNKNDLADKDYYYKGQEDDDDFEKLIVENFDLALRKFIVSVNDEELKNSDGTYVREPVVDTSKLGTTDENGKTITTATYNHPKTPVQVKKGDIITYTIRIYNEGTLAGFANEITDNIPDGLEFIEDSSINKSYAWELKDGKLVTTYLSDSNINNVINPVTELEDGTKTLSYKDVKVQFKVVAEPSKYAGETITNWAEIQEDSNNDIDSTPGNNNKEEDDIDYEPVQLTYFDLALRKFITKVNTTEINNRVPEVDTSKIGTVDENGNKITTATYKHTKNPITLETGSTVIYTIRVYNEGTIDGYATEITDNIPEGLEFLPTDETNVEYKWVMIDETGNITQDVSKAKKITTNYLSEENDSTQIINKYDPETKTLSYKDVKVAFKVVEPKTSDRIIVNTAEISKASDEDIDSTPGNNEKAEDDIDNEYVKVESFDLSLKKWVTATKVTYDGKTKVTKTGFDENSTEMAKVDLVGKKLKKTTVKFVYSIKVLNEGEVAGYATEIKDYIPSGLEFKAEDNPDWTLQKDGTATTDKLKDTLLEPGQSAVVEITLTWKNSSSNMGVKTNWAEISADSGDDIDSTPNNNQKGEDDIDDASVILSIKTGNTTMYVMLTLVSVTILAGGAFLVKKHVIDK